MFCFRAKSVPENIIKKQARDAKLLAHFKANRDAAKKDRVAKRKLAETNAKKYHDEYNKND